MESNTNTNTNERHEQAKNEHEANVQLQLQKAALKLEELDEKCARAFFDSKVLEKKLMEGDVDAYLRGSKWIIALLSDQHEEITKQIDENLKKLSELNNKHLQLFGESRYRNHEVYFNIMIAEGSWKKIQAFNLQSIENISYLNQKVQEVFLDAAGHVLLPQRQISDNMSALKQLYYQFVTRFIIEDNLEVLEAFKNKFVKGLREVEEEVEEEIIRAVRDIIKAKIDEIKHLKTLKVAEKIADGIIARGIDRLDDKDLATRYSITFLADKICDAMLEKLTLEQDKEMFNILCGAIKSEIVEFSIKQIYGVDKDRNIVAQGLILMGGGFIDLLGEKKISKSELAKIVRGECEQKADEIDRTILDREGREERVRLRERLEELERQEQEQELERQEQEQELERQEQEQQLARLELLGEMLDLEISVGAKAA